ncbi:MAG: hypothetical protein QOE08_2302 [Thermoleophilaceae bacterium]|nr:hypothetical protein [Thermoleophilaceae bacterium]
MPWVETDSASFTARHEAEDADAALELLDELERYRDDLEGIFEIVPGDLAVVIHSRAIALSLAHPWLPLARRVAAPASRRYMAGWFSSGEIHVLAPSALEERASAVPGSREALMLSPLHEYTHVVVGANNPGLPPPFNLASFRRYLRWAWLCEGAAAHFCGQTPHMRGAIARRLHEGPKPTFPPSARDAPLLGGTVLALLERELGPEAVVALVQTLDPQGATVALAHAFERPAAQADRDWREYLTAFTSGAASGERERPGTVHELRPRRDGRPADGEGA